MKYHAHAAVTVSLYAEIEADSEAEALEKAAALEMPELCYGCATQNGYEEAWRPDMDGLPKDVRLDGEVDE